MVFDCLNHVALKSPVLIEKQEDEYDIVAIIMICVLAGMAPIALLSLVITIYKLRRREYCRCYSILEAVLISSIFF